MMKTRYQQRIAFPRRKTRSRSKSEVKGDDLEPAKTCCITTLARSCRERVKGVETVEKKIASPAKKTKSNECGNSVGEKENAIVTVPSRTRRFLSYQEESDNSQRSQCEPETQKQSPRKTVASSPRRSAVKVPSITVVVETPRKNKQDTNNVLLHGSPVTSSPVKQAPHTHSPLSLTRSGKRRHSSGSIIESISVPTRILSKSTPCENRPRSATCSEVTAREKKQCSSENVSPNRHLLCVGAQDAHLYKDVKHVLHSSIPGNLLCRETETRQINTFLKYHLVHKKPGSLYISGAPGTGKTACLTHILEKMQKNGLECHVQFINCMNMSQSHRIFSKITEELTGWDKLTNKEAQKFLEKKFTGQGKPVVLVLDEIDQLESKNQDVLYTMFEWPSLPSSRLILIGIANALDLTDRVLPRLQLRAECKPKLLHFSPYSKDQIVKILTARLSEVEGSNIVDVSAVQFCARKIAAVSGDMRKALDICRRAVEVVESEVKRQQVLKPIEITSSPSKKAIGKKVTIAHVSKVISEVYGSRMMSSSGGEQQTIPLQQKLLICTILLMQKETKLREIPVGQLHETYCNICKKRQVSQISQEDCLALCNLLETRGIITMKRAKETRMAKVSLKIDEKEVDYALQDKILLTSILQAGLGNY